MREAADITTPEHGFSLLGVVPPLYVRLDKLETLTTLSTATIQAMVARNEFPPPRELSARRVAWLYREVVEWAESRPISSILPPPNTGAKKPRGTR